MTNRAAAATWLLCNLTSVRLRSSTLSGRCNDRNRLESRLLETTTAATAAHGRLSNGCGELLGCHEERLAERAAEVVPGVDLLRRLGPEPLGVGRGVLRVDDPVRELLRGHLGVELHTPARVAEAERLGAR